MNLSESSVSTPPEDDEHLTQAADKNEAEREKNWKRWKFEYLANNIKMCAFKVNGTKDQKPLFEFCKYILCNPQNNSLVVCFDQAKPRSWFHQFYYLDRYTLREFMESHMSSVGNVVKELGPDYKILYEERNDKNKKENDSGQLLSPSPQRQQQQQQKEKQQGGDSYQERTSKKPKEKDFVQETGEDFQDSLAPKETQKPKKRDNFLSDPEIESLSWFDRIKEGETVKDIGKEIAKKGDKELAFLYLENFERLKEEEIKLGKRPQNKAPEEEKKVQKLLKTEKGRMILPSKREEIKRERRRLSKEKPEKEIKNEEKPKVQDENEMLANCCAYYRHQEFFDEKIRPLPAFKKELEAFENTISPEQKKEVEEAMNEGFNPVYYIYKFKTKEKDLHDIRLARSKKGFKNSSVLGIVHDYIAAHL